MFALRRSIVPAGHRLFTTSALRSAAIENQLKTETNKLEKTLTKFWDKIHVESNDKEVMVKLDNKCIRTPLGYDLRLPKEKQLLAQLIALEWRSLPNLLIKPHQVPLTSLTARALDFQLSEGTTDSEVQAKIGDRHIVNETMLRYLDTDTLLIFAPVEEFDGNLRKEQDELYKPMITTVEKFLTKYHPNHEQIKLNYLDVELHGIRANRQSEATRVAATEFLNSLNVWQFVAFEKVVLSSKSFICGVYTIKLLSEDAEFEKLPLEKIIRAFHLETIYQTDRWGEVEDTHDVENEDIRRNLTSSMLVAYK